MMDDLNLNFLLQLWFSDMFGWLRNGDAKLVLVVEGVCVNVSSVKQLIALSRWRMVNRVGEHYSYN